MANPNDINYTPAGKSTTIPLPPNQYQIPINSLFTSVFGIAGPLIRKYKVPADEKKSTNPVYEVGEMKNEVREDTVQSYLGTPVNFPMQFNGGSYNYRDVKKGQIAKRDNETCLLPHASVATFSRSHRDTETYMSGQNGSVIEEYGFEPWEIRIQGFIIANPSEGTVEEQVKRLEQWEYLSDEISVTGRIFMWLGIDKIAFKKVDYLPGRALNLESVLPFEISARSVETIELI